MKSGGRPHSSEPNEPLRRSARLTRWERRTKMFGRLYDKADWAVGVLLVVAILAAVVL